MRKQPNGAPGKKLPAFSVSTTQLERAAACLAGYRRQALEILSGASPSGYTTLLAQNGTRIHGRHAGRLGP
jgi:hypothetical protein